MNDKTMNEEKELCRQNYMHASRVIVAGGRDFEDYGYLSATLDGLFGDTELFRDRAEIKIVSGMAKGADTLAIRYADERKMTKILFPANWRLHPRRAGFLRNEDMLTVATHLIAFWDGNSHGTQHVIEEARKKGIPVWVFRY